MNPEVPLSADVSNLARWLLTWVQPSGAIHGFHNHTIWGENPGRTGDWTCGHTTFASPLISALARAWQRVPDERGLEVVLRLLRFQIGSHQDDGQFAHIGFQNGERGKVGLVHNMAPVVTLCDTVSILGDTLDETTRHDLDRAVRRVFDACDRIHGSAYANFECTNQEYLRQWARLEHMKAFRHDEFNECVRRDLAALEASHVRGMPDEQSIGTLRQATLPHGLIEPCEYYGLMLMPLVCAYERYHEQRWLDQALGIARHVVRSAWRDDQEHLRPHRMWQWIGNGWRKIRLPMCISGMGYTCRGLKEVARLACDAEIGRAVEDFAIMYAAYQHPAGFILPAEGWYAEQDLAPCTAWESHDLLFLLEHQGVPGDFWEKAFAPRPGVAAVFGPASCWLETDTHWALRGYDTAHGLDWVGCKDRDRFGISPTWIKPWPDDRMIDEPAFVNFDGELIQIGGSRDLHWKATPGNTIRLANPFITSQPGNHP